MLGIVAYKNTITRSTREKKQNVTQTIAIVANAAWNIKNFRLGLARALIEQGFRILAIAPEDEHVAELERAGCEFVPLKSLARNGTNPFRDLQLFFELLHIYKREKVNIALHYTIKPNIYGALAGSITGTKTICTVTGLGYSFSGVKMINTIVRKLYKFAFHKADRIFFQNPDDLNLFVSEGLVHKTYAQLVPGSGIDTDCFSPSHNVKSMDGKLRFLFVGRLLYDKGIRELLEAMRIIQEKYAHVHLRIVGAIDHQNPAAISESKLESWLDQNPSVEYVGTTNDVRSQIGRSDIVILPSYREGLPRGVLEGLAMGKPIITTDVPGCRETVVEGKNGFLAKVKDAKHLAETIERMILLPESTRAQMGNYSRKLALDRFDEKIVIKYYLEEIATTLQPVLSF